jgi:hypothetical protein
MKMVKQMKKKKKEKNLVEAMGIEPMSAEQQM